MSKNYSNINYVWGSLIVEELIRCGVQYFCIAPGSRSSPLTISVARHPKAKTFIHFDERGLAFHALGYVTAVLKKPAVLICTSGTAVANFMPAVVEASKKKLPLIVITADRPPELRQTGAVQTIDQVGIFGKYALWQMDMPCPDINIKPNFVLTTIDQAVYQASKNKGVVHLNCMFREPLTPIEVKADWAAYTKSIDAWQKSDKPFTSYVASKDMLDVAQVKQLVESIKKIKNGIVVVGKIGDSEEQKAAIALAAQLGWPIFADIASGLRTGYNNKNIIHYYDQILLKGLKTKIDGILHLGGRITSKRYYEFIQAQAPSEYIMVLNHGLRSDPQHQVTLRVQSNVKNFCKALKPLLPLRKASALLTQLVKLNTGIDKGIDAFFKGEQRICEPYAARLISQLMPKGSGLFLANSMPIRDMDMYADYKGSLVHVAGNRGASGIDGLIASSIGYAQGLKSPVTLMVGDLAALHDLNSLAMLKDAQYPLIIVIINNGGGAIFSFLPVVDQSDVFEKYFGTPHPFSFASAAAMFELNYAQPQCVDELRKSYEQAIKSNTSTIIEIMTSRSNNLEVHKNLQASLIP